MSSEKNVSTYTSVSRAEEANSSNTPVARSDGTVLEGARNEALLKPTV